LILVRNGFKTLQRRQVWFKIMWECEDAVRRPNDNKQLACCVRLCTATRPTRRRASQSNQFASKWRTQSSTPRWRITPCLNNDIINAWGHNIWRAQMIYVIQNRRTENNQERITTQCNCMQPALNTLTAVLDRSTSSH
jgi:hypothetical protein